LLLAAVLLTGCRTGYTIPEAKLADYAAEKPVLTVDGATLSLADGGDLRLVPLHGSCFSEVQAGPRPDGGRLSVVKAADSGCADPHVDNVRALRVGPLIEIEGTDETVTAERGDIAGVEVFDVRIPEIRDRATRMRSPGTVYAAVPVLAIGLAVGTGLLVGGATYDSNMSFDFTGVTMMLFGGPLLVSNVVAGTVMLAVGASPVPVTRSQASIRPRGAGFAW
jgi:hypothetical protein